MFKETLLTLFPIINPIGSIPLLIALTKNFSRKERLQIAAIECGFALLLMLLVFGAGKALMHALGIGTLAVQAAGAVLLFKVGMEMNFPSQAGLGGLFGLQPGEKPFLIPISTPMLVGGGLITKLIALSNDSEHLYSNLCAMVAVAFISLLIFWSSEFILKIIGKKGINILERFMGLLLIMMSMETFFHIVKELLTHSLTALK